MLPRLEGAPIRVIVRRDLGPHLAATSIPRRTIELDREVLSQRGDFERILVHELFHFVWIRLGNPLRHEWSELLAAEFARGSRGELGWSAEWRKNKLQEDKVTSSEARQRGSAARERDPTARKRSPMWSRYVRESFCDTAAWCYSGLTEHDEFTLVQRDRTRRGAWFARTFATNSAGILKV